MKIINELADLANKANISGQGTPEMVEFRVTANPDNILAIAEAFRALECEVHELRREKQNDNRYQELLKLGTAVVYECDEAVRRADAAEAKLAELANKKPDIMVSAEGAEAIRAIMNREMSAAGRYVTLKRPSRIGEEGMMGIYIRPAPAVGMDKPEPYAWLVHAPQGDYVERNPEVVAHLEGTGLTKCKPLYLDL